MESPLVVWIPSIAVAGMTVYTGDRFPKWKGNVFVGSMRTGDILAPVIWSVSFSMREPRSDGANRCWAN